MIYKFFVILILFASVQSQDGWVEHFQAFQDEKLSSLEGWYVQNAQSQNRFTNQNGKHIFGGTGIFTKGTAISKNIRLPPHYLLKVEVQFWKINNWDNQKMQIFVDGFLYQANLGNSEDFSMYNIWFNVQHNSPQVAIVITSTLESQTSFWGIREVKLSYKPCPSQCGICSNDDPRLCSVYQQVAMTWMKPQVAIEGWTLTGGFDRSTNCAGIEIYGGQGNIGKGSVLSNQFTKLPPHYKLLVKFQFWKIDSWDNEQFRLSLDNQLVFYQNFRWNEGISLCGNENNKDWAEKVVNVEVEIPHRQPAATISMTSTLDEDFDNESWGIRDFYLFIAQCYQFCTSCTGPSKSDCLSCAQGFQLENGVCKMTSQWTVHSKSFNAGNKDIDNWAISNGAPEPFVKCKENSLFGGYEKFGGGTFVSKDFRLPNHSKIRVELQLWKIGFWNGEQLFVKLGDQVIFSVNLGYNDPGQSNDCGIKNSKERVMNVDVILVHTDPVATIKVGSTINQNTNAFWGMKDFQLSYEVKEECAIFYSECNFLGQSFEVCNSISSFIDVNLTFSVKSIRIPNNMVITGFGDMQYKGKRVKYTESQSCLQDSEFSFEQIESESQMKDISHNFRKTKLLN